VIETKGGNHKTLKEWKAKWGSDVVEGWATLLGLSNIPLAPPVCDAIKTPACWRFFIGAG
jgi:hypothetical protein